MLGNILKFDTKQSNKNNLRTIIVFFKLLKSHDCAEVKVLSIKIPICLSFKVSKYLSKKNSMSRYVVHKYYVLFNVSKVSMNFINVIIKKISM